MKIILTLLLFTFGSQAVTFSQAPQKKSKVYLVKIYRDSNKSVKGILYQVDDSSIQVYADNISIGKKYIDSMRSEMKTYSFREISKIKIVKRGSVGVAGGAVIGLFSGIIVGSFTGFAIGGGFDNEQNSSTDLNRVLGFFVGGMLGAAVGLPTGAAVGGVLDQSPHKKFIIDTNYDQFKLLKEKLQQFAFKK